MTLAAPGAGAAPRNLAPNGKVWQVHTDPLGAVPQAARPVRAASPSGSTQTAAASSPACSTSHPNAFQIVYARPSDVPSRLSSLQSRLLADAAAAADRIQAESGSVSPKRPRFLCGIVDVATTRMAALYGPDPIWDIIDDLRARGYGATNRKYVVWWDGPRHPLACGEGTFADDDTPSAATNDNNTGPDYALMYKPQGGPDFCSWTTVLHEMGHTLGSVMQTAPHSTTNWHCTDENDIMCYEDGPGVVTNEICAGSYEFFDCNKDDYFSPSPASGSYLSTHWNTYNSSWLEAAPAAAPPPDPTPPPSGGGVPDTTLTGGPSGLTRQSAATFTFTATVAGATFDCSLDGEPAEPCTSPATYSGLGDGAHTFEVVASTTDGADETPATRSWTVDATNPYVSMTHPTSVVQPSRSVWLGWNAGDGGGALSKHRIRYRAASSGSGFGGHVLWREQSGAGAWFIGGQGVTYCVSVQVVDAAGNASAWTSERCFATPLDDRRASVYRIQQTTGSSFYERTVAVGRTGGGTMTWSNLRARSLAVTVQVCSTCRYVDAYWNGRLIKKMSLTAQSARMVTVPLASFSSVTSGTLRLVVRSPVVVIDSISAPQV